MKAKIIQIGNSKGLRLSKAILDQYNIKDKVELKLEKGQIVIKPVEEPRKGWRDAFQKMAENREDKPLMDDVFEDENLPNFPKVFCESKQ